MIEDKVYAARSILVVGAHAFDAEVIAGPLAAAAAKGGVQVTFLHLSMGEQGHPCLIPEHYSGQKEDE
ncbi:MAG: LmbE-like protein, partial [Mesorhizobium sp.]